MQSPFAAHSCQSTLSNWLLAIKHNSTMRRYSKHWRAFEKKERKKERERNMRRPKEPLCKPTSTKNTTGKLRDTWLENKDYFPNLSSYCPQIRLY